jgi:D-proline reductase (dithiol) PrdB
VAIPVVHFRRLVEAKAIKRLHPWAYSFMGYLPEPHQLIHKSGPQVARLLAAEGIEAAFLTPC